MTSSAMGAATALQLGVFLASATAMLVTVTAVSGAVITARRARALTMNKS